MKQVLGIFAKQPAAGAVKTRLAAQTSPDWAARVYEAFLLDVLDRFEHLTVRRVVVYDPPESIAYFQQQVRSRYELIAQGPGDLGRRMAQFFHEQIEAGMESAVVIGADSPTAPPAVIQQAFAELARADVVLGPATDGGYYLIGLARAVPPIFSGIDWSTNRVLAQTAARLQAAAAHHSLQLLPLWYDVDTLADWELLRGHVAALRYSGEDPGIPRTEALLQVSSQQDFCSK